MSTQWPLVIFTLLAGTGAGTLAFAGISAFFNIAKKTRLVAGIIALILFVIGGIASILHLGSPGNVMAATGQLFSGSPISLELLALGLAIVVAIVSIAVTNREGSVAKGVGVVGILAALFLAYVVGHGYEVIASRPGWHTPALSFAYLGSGLTIGGFLFLALAAAARDEEPAVKALGRILIAVAAVETIAFLAYGFSVPLGDNALLFWGGVVVIGGVAALIVAFVLQTKTSALVYVGLICAFVGGVAFRVLMWTLGSPAIPNAFDIAANSRGLFPF
jgi:anaerobic dimethyl sulfoxide reductase subunit C (anchor subunit)